MRSEAEATKVVQDVIQDFRLRHVRTIAEHLLRLAYDEQDPISMWLIAKVVSEQLADDYATALLAELADPIKLVDPAEYHPAA